MTTIRDRWAVEHPVLPEGGELFWLCDAVVRSWRRYAGVLPVFYLQRSTYALTLYRHDTKVDEESVAVGTSRDSRPALGGWH